MAKKPVNHRKFIDPRSSDQAQVINPHIHVDDIDFLNVTARRFKVTTDDVLTRVIRLGVSSMRADFARQLLAHHGINGGSVQ